MTIVNQNKIIAKSMIFGKVDFHSAFNEGLQ